MEVPIGKILKGMSNYNTMSDLLSSFRNFREFDQFCFLQILCNLVIISMSYEFNLFFRSKSVKEVYGIDQRNDFDESKLCYMIAVVGLHIFQLAASIRENGGSIFRS